MSDRKGSGLKLTLDKRRILLIEDSSQLLSTVSAFLFRAGAWDVWQAHDRSRALVLWAEHRDKIDVVIADERLPDGRGLDLLRHLRRDQMDLCCLLISGAPVVDCAEFHGASLLKPFTEEELIRALNAMG